VSAEYAVAIVEALRAGATALWVIACVLLAMFVDRLFRR
jgi:hypothetical protein